MNLYNYFFPSKETYSRTSPYLVGNFKPVETETSPTKVECYFGQVPEDLQGGLFLRTGPNPKYFPDGLYHWFDGDGFLHGVKFLKNNDISYCGRYVLTDRLIEETRQGQMTFFRLGWMFGNSTELLKRIFWLNFKKAIGYVKTLPPLREGTANTSIEFHEGRILALQEVSLPFHIVEKEGDFKSIGYLDYNEKLKHGFTAHPKICPISGEMRFFGYDSFKDPHFNYSVVKNDEIITNFSIEKEQLPYPTMMHDFGITQNYSIVIDFPLIFDLNLAKQGKFPVTFKSDFPSRFGVFPKHASDSSNITWFTVKTCYMFHLLNCWEDTNVDGDLIINIVGCRSPGFNFKYNAEVVNENKNKFKPYIWKLNFSKKIVVSENEIVTSLGEEKTMDFPKCHPKLQGLPVKYGYFSILLATNDIIGSVKINLKTMKEEKVLIFGEGKSGGETWFEPKKLAKSEDDGYLLTFVHDMKNVEANESELWIWDALTMNETPLAKIKIPSRIPYGFHCKFISKEQLLQQK